MADLPAMEPVPAEGPVAEAAPTQPVVPEGPLTPLPTATEKAIGAFGQGIFDRIARSGGQRDVLMALGVIAILVVLILPMPRWALDISLALSITFSVLILMTVMFLDRPLDFNAFPKILLIATM